MLVVYKYKKGIIVGNIKKNAGWLLILRRVLFRRAAFENLYCYGSSEVTLITLAKTRRNKTVITWIPQEHWIKPRFNLLFNAYWIR